MTASLPLIGLGLTAIGTGVGVFGAITGAQAQAEAFNRQTAIDKRNQRIANKNAKTVLRTGQDEALEQDMQTAELLAEQITIQAGSGFSVNSRSHVMTRRAARELGRQDTMRVVEAVRIRAEAYRDQANAFAADAAINARAAASATLAGYINASSAIISGATTFINSPFFQTTSNPVQQQIVPDVRSF